MDSVDFFTVLIAALAYVIIEGIWYSPWTFRPLWQKLNGTLKSGKNSIFSFVGAYLSAVIMAYVLSLFEIFLGATSFWDGIFAGFIAWLGFVATTQISSVLWSSKSMKLYFLENGCYLIGMVVMGAILAG